MSTIAACLKELRERRNQLNDAIFHLEKLQDASQAAIEAPLRPRAGRAVKRGSKASKKGVNGSTTISPSLTCTQCQPPRQFLSARSLTMHTTWRHTGRKGAEKSLIGSTLQN